nr:hypothetical protein [uncultured Cohaesibacter sp.]
MVFAPFIAGSIGAVVGLMIAVFANIVVLPYVLKAQEDGFVLGRKATISNMGPEAMARFTRFMYRVPMPVMFAFVGWFVGLNAFGGY